MNRDRASAIAHTDSVGMREWASEARARRTLGPGVLGFALVLASRPG